MEAINEMNQGKSGFAAGTLVHTKDGLKTIEEICVSDWVLSFPDDQVPPAHIREERELTYKKVTRTFTQEDVSVCEVIVLNFASSFKETLKAALDQPIFVKRKGYLPAGKLNFRCALESENFGNLATAEITIGIDRVRVYNFEVDEFHTYYVGRLGVWVHDACGSASSLPGY
jgi:hypothetical protein